MGQIIDLAIIGGGPAGAAGVVYAARKHIKTTLITESFGGQSVVSPDIKNWIGTPSITGTDLAKTLESHVREYEGEHLSIKYHRAEKVEDMGDHFSITLSDGSVVLSKMLLITTGSERRKIRVPGADEYEHKGLTYCATCDGPFFAGKDIAVVGGGNAGFETAAQLLAYAKSVKLLHKNNFYKADATTVEKILSHPNIEGILNAQITEVLGDTFVTGIKYVDTVSGKEKALDVQGVFVEIGLIPATSLVEDLVDTDDYKRIVTDPRTGKTSHKKIWAAGDSTDALFHQNNIAAGDATKAVESIYLDLVRGD